MKVSHLNFSDANGGAARAAYRIHQALRSLGVDSMMHVNSAASGDWTVSAPQRGVEKALSRVGRKLASQLSKSLRTANPIIHSPAMMPSSWRRRLNESDADLIHLHWVNNEMISVRDIGQLSKPLVWTLHDMWAFCGAEHIAGDHRWRDGYTPVNRPAHEAGFDLNRWTWKRKRNHWNRPIQVVAPSRWLATCAKESALMRDWPVAVIPNAIDTDLWHAENKTLARQVLDLPSCVPLVLFGAFGGTKEPHKGFDLLQIALGHLRQKMPDLQLVVFGELAPKEPLDIGYRIHYTGHLHDNVSLRLLYSAADLMVIPSRQENLPNIGVEAHACGTPVVAFNTCGLPDVVEHQVTGYLAEAFDATDLARGICWVLNDKTRLQALCQAARERAVLRWSNRVVATQYIAIYADQLPQLQDHHT